MKYLNFVFENDEVTNLVDSNQELINEATGVCALHSVLINNYIQENLEEFITTNDSLISIYENIRDYSVQESLDLIDVTNEIIADTELSLEEKHYLLTEAVDEYIEEVNKASNKSKGVASSLAPRIKVHAPLKFNPSLPTDKQNRDQINKKLKYEKNTINTKEARRDRKVKADTKRMSDLGNQSQNWKFKGPSTNKSYIDIAKHNINNKFDTVKSNLSRATRNAISAVNPEEGIKANKIGLSNYLRTKLHALKKIITGGKTVRKSQADTLRMIRNFKMPDIFHGNVNSAANQQL